MWIGGITGGWIDGVPRTPDVRDDRQHRGPRDLVLPAPARCLHSFGVAAGITAALDRQTAQCSSRGAIGLTPFGIEFTGYPNHLLVSKRTDAAMVEPFAANDRLVATWSRVWAKLAARGKVRGVRLPDDDASQRLTLGRFRATVSWNEWQFGRRKWWPADVGEPEVARFPTAVCGLPRSVAMSIY